MCHCRRLHRIPFRSQSVQRPLAPPGGSPATSAHPSECPEPGVSRRGTKLRVVRPTEIAWGAPRAPHLLRAVLPRGSGEVGFVIGRPGDQCICGAHFVRGELFIDRRGLRAAGFHEDFPARHNAPLPAGVETLTLEIVLDRNSIECFACDGEVVLSDLVFFDEAPGIRTLDGTQVW